MKTHDNGESAIMARKRNPVLLVAGFLVLGIAVALLFFGGSLLGATSNSDASSTAAELDQVPDFGEPAQSAMIELPTGGGPLQVGDTAYDFVVSDLDGNPVALSDYIGRPLIINLWATWCAPCRIEMPELQRTFEAYQDDDLMILALDQGESAEDVRAFFFDEFDLTFTPLLDKEGKVAELYGSFNLPTTFFIDASGTVTAIHRGPMVQQQIEGYLADTILPNGVGEIAP